MEIVAARPLGEHTKLSAAPRARPRLRVALIVDSPLQPRWAIDSFVKLAGSDFVELVAVSELTGVQRSAPWLWAAYCRMDKWAFGPELDPLQRIDVKSELPHLPYVKSAQRTPQWRRELRSLGLDILFALGEIENDELAGIARYGVWRYCFGSGAEHHSLAGIQEFALGAPVMPSGVKAALQPGEPERLLYQSWSRTCAYSLARTRNNVLPKSTEFAERALKLLYEKGEPWIRTCPSVEPSHPWPTGGRARPEQFLRLVSVLGYRLARAVQMRAYVQQWFLAYRFGGNLSWQGDFRDFTWMLPPKDRFWADPFPLRRADRYWIFFEELIFERGKAHISVVEVDRDGTRSEPIKVLERAYHLSYPFLIEHGSDLFMIPETGANRSVEIYRCKRFPDEWALEEVLLRGRSFTDATVHRTGGRWWLFTNLSPAGTEGTDELNLYYAERLFGPWIGHRQNPVKSDIRGARPAGRLYERDGKLYRPAQIGVPIYGGGVSINQVLRLTPEDYEETEVQRVVPAQPSEILGIHTLNRADDLTVVDGFTRRPRLWERAPWR